jgi:hydrogenase expression/formation protein HypC
LTCIKAAKRLFFYDYDDARPLQSSAQRDARGFTATSPEVCMCLGIPMRILDIDGHVARCDAKGVERDVNLFLLGDRSPEVGDFVMVHVGYAIQLVEAREARSVWELHDAMQALEDSQRDRKEP